MPAAELGATAMMYRRGDILAMMALLQLSRIFNAPTFIWLRVLADDIDFA
jgi:hypothetical protein